MADHDRAYGVPVYVVKAAPRDDLVGPHQREWGLVELACHLGGYVGDREFKAQAACGINEALSGRRRRTQAQERPFEPKRVEE